MFVDFILNMFLAIILVSIFNLARYIFKIRKLIKMHKDNPNIQGITIINGEVRVIEKHNNQEHVVENVAKELVNDPICGLAIDKKDAYRVLKEDKEHFFCSWECREKFLNGGHSDESRNNSNR